MERPLRGDVVIVAFPFSDLSMTKKRPALVVAQIEGDDCIICQISSTRSDTYSISLSKEDFAQGTIDRQTSIRPNKIFTAHKELLQYSIGTITLEKQQEVEQMIHLIFANRYI